MPEPTRRGGRLRPVPDPDIEGALARARPREGEEGAHAGITPPTKRGGRGRFVSDVLVDLEFASRERVDAAIEQARTAGRTPEQVLLAEGTINSDQLSRALAERFGLDHVDLSAYNVNMGAANLVSVQTARRYKAVPIDFVDEGTLLLAMADPANVLAVDDLGIMTGHDIRLAVASVDDIEGLIGRLSKLDAAVAEALEAEEEEEAEEVTDIRESAENAPVIKLVHSIISQAVEARASDIHFEPEGKEMRVRYRVDGVLSDATTVPRRMVAGVVSRVKIMSSLDIAERRLPQDGRLGLQVDGRPVDIRVTTLPSAHGENVVMRLLDKSQVMIELDKLGLQGEALQRFRQSVTRPYGAIFATGPTGSGKSTTLYAALNLLNTPEVNVITIEDPVEYQLAGITQIQINPKAGLTFASGLRSMLRADPDIIMVGEIRDYDTARIAIEAALTGHLVLSTLHTNDAPTTLTRLVEMGVEPFLTASALDLVVAQRLARTLCVHCKRRTALEAEALRNSGFDTHYEVEAYEPVGCARCAGTGYRGRIGLFEVMPISDGIRNLTIDRASADDICAVARKEGMRTLREDGLEKVRQGVVSVEEVARVTS